MDATARQLEILRAIASLTEVRGYPPTLHELSWSLGMKAKGGAASGLKALVAKGLLHVEPRCARSMVITDGGRDALTSYVGDSNEATGL